MGFGNWPKILFKQESMKIKYQNWVFIMTLGIVLFSCEEEKFDVKKFGSVSGVVVDGDGYSPLAGVLITTSPASSAILTDENGSFELSKVPMGDVLISAKKEDYLSSSVTVAVYDEDNTNLTFFLSLDENNAGSVVIYDPVPGNGSVDQAKDLTLGWQVDQSNLDTPLTYSVYLFESNSTTQKNIGQGLATTELVLSGLKANTTYYWYVLAKYEGKNVANSPTWTFRTGS